MKRDTFASFETKMAGLGAARRGIALNSSRGAMAHGDCILRHTEKICEKAMRRLGNWIGRRIAELHMLLVDKPFIPCQVDWYQHNVDALKPAPKDDCCSECDGLCMATDTMGEAKDWWNGYKP